MATGQSFTRPLSAFDASSSIAQPTAQSSPTLENIRAQLDAGHVDKALALAHKNASDLELKNAIGVCHIRLGQADKAIGIYRSMTLASGGVYLKPDVPDKYKINFATALLLAGNVSGCMSILGDLQDPHGSAAQRLQAAVGRWKKTLSIWQRIDLAFGGQPDRPVELDFPPGEV